MPVTQKQSEFLEDFKRLRDKKNLFILAGGAGSGKSFICLLLLHKLCLEFAPLRVGVFRKTTANLKNNTIPSYRRVLAETATESSVTLSECHAVYKNGSEILFLWADTEKDPDCNNIKGLELSCALFEEVNQVEKKVFHTIRSRVGRWNSGIKCPKTLQEADFKPFVLANCNPNNTWVKNDFYDPYVGGNLPENVYFQESLPTDNPKLSPEYIKMLETLPDEEKRRYLHNDWYWAQSQNSLVSRELLDAAWVKSASDELFGEVILAIDPADEGADSTVFCYIRANFAFKFEVFDNLNEVKAAHLALLRARDYGIKPYNIIVDSVGVGAGCLNTLLGEGFPAVKFVGGESASFALPFYDFKNKRAEAAWFLRESIHSGELKILENQRLKNEILAVKYSVDNDKTIVLQQKKDIKKVLGHSPDIFDALMMANYHAKSIIPRPIKAITHRVQRLSPMVRGF